MRKTFDPVTPLPAATIVLLREGRAGLEVYLTKRSTHMPFLGGFHVFPGGKCEVGDGLLSGDRMAASVKGDATEADADAALYGIAAIRELFEETGFLLLDGELPSLEVQESVREKLSSGATDYDFAAFRREYALRCDLSKLRYFARWITPEISPYRYDTRFFVAQAPENQNSRADQIEVVDDIWLTPRAALTAYEKKVMLLIEPTQRSLRFLANFESIEQVFSPDAFRASLVPQS